MKKITLVIVALLSMISVRQAKCQTTKDKELVNMSNYVSYLKLSAPTLSQEEQKNILMYLDSLIIRFQILQTEFDSLSIENQLLIKEKNSLVKENESLLKEKEYSSIEMNLIVEENKILRMKLFLIQGLLQEKENVKDSK